GAGGDALVEGGAAVVVEDAEGKGPGVGVDAGVESVRSVVEAHVMVSLGWAGPEPASWLGGTPSLKIPRCDKARSWLVNLGALWYKGADGIQVSLPRSGACP